MPRRPSDLIEIVAERFHLDCRREPVLFCIVTDSPYGLESRAAAAAEWQPYQVMAW
jgi:hypothetical protein